MPPATKREKTIAVAAAVKRRGAPSRASSKMVSSRQRSSVWSMGECASM